MDDSLKVEFQENLNQLETGKDEAEEEDNSNPNTLAKRWIGTVPISDVRLYRR